MGKRRKRNEKGNGGKVGSKRFVESVRAFVLDQDTRKPISSLPVTASVTQTEGRGCHLGLLRTDRNGYVSFKLGSPVALDTVDRVAIEPFGRTELAFDMLSGIRESGDATPQQVRWISADLADLDRIRTLPSIQNADAIDYGNSPSSLATQTDLLLGGVDCETLIPANPATSTYQYGEIVKTEEQSIDTDPSQDISECTGDPQVRAIGNGELMVYELVVEPQGYSLGDILYTVPLAPCEEVKIAVVDWSRVIRSSRSDVSSQVQEYTGTYDRGVFTTEVLNGALFEATSSYAQTSGAKGGIDLAGLLGLSGGSIPIIGYYGSGLAINEGMRQLAANTTLNVTESVVQKANVYQQYNSVVVFEDSQIESEDITTRSIRNHNHCHTITLTYYQVLKHIRLENAYLGSGDVVLVRYENASFWESKILRYRHILENVLLDQSLKNCFDKIAEEYICGAIEIDSTDSEPVDATVSKVSVEMTMGNNAFDGRIYFTMDAGGVKSYITGESSGKRYKKNEKYTDEINLSSPVAAKDIHTIGLTSEKDQWTDAGFKIDRLKVTYTVQETGETGSLYNKSGMDLDLDGNDSWSTSASPDVLTFEPEEGASSTASDTYSYEDKCCAAKLIKHLNCNKLHYNKAIWIHEDPDERAIRFGDIPFEDTNLIDYIDNRPIAVSGDWVAFRSVDYGLRASDEDIRESTYLTTPTRGVFSEALPGRCNACEVKDEERFWDWSESPCGDSAPDITVSAGSKGVDVSGNLAPGVMPDIVNVTTGAEMPTTSLTSALEALATTGVFNYPDVLASLKDLLNDIDIAVDDLIAKAEESESETDTSESGDEGS